jgi:hypothetical protein
MVSHRIATSRQTSLPASTNVLLTTFHLQFLPGLDLAEFVKARNGNRIAVQGTTTFDSRRDSMNNMNFFGWIRDGVRQSVLLGVSDAVEQLGTPAAIEELHPSVAGFLKVDSQANTTANLTQSTPGSGGLVTNHKSRRRLGKSLKDIGSTTSQ